MFITASLTFSFPAYSMGSGRKQQAAEDGHGLWLDRAAIICVALWAALRVCNRTFGVPSRSVDRRVFYATIFVLAARSIRSFFRLMRERGRLQKRRAEDAKFRASVLAKKGL